MAVKEVQSKKTNRKPRRVGKLAAIIFGAIILVLIILWIGLRALFFHSFAPSKSHASDYELYGSRIPIAEKPQADPQIHNYLLIGTDSRFSHGSPMEGNSDTVIVATYNSRNKSYALTSLMRDAHVPVFGMGSDSEPYYDKLKGAFRLGGIGCLINTVNDVFGLDIQKYVVIGLEGFIRVIDDVLHGIDLELTGSDIAFINSRITDYENESELIKNAPLIQEEPGLIHLTGAQALIYIRNRTVSFQSEEPDRFSLKRHTQKQVYRDLLEKGSGMLEQGLLTDAKSRYERRITSRYLLISPLKKDLIEMCSEAARNHPLFSGENTGSEYDRAARQQLLLRTIYRKFLDTWTVSDIPGILRICSDTIETNLTPEEMISLAIPLMDHEQEIHTYSVPFEDTWEYGLDGSGIVFEYDETADMLHEVLYG